MANTENTLKKKKRKVNQFLKYLTITVTENRAFTLSNSKKGCFKIR